jgi:hypothetical protein
MVVGASAFALGPLEPGVAQVFGPPMTLYGSIADSEGPIAAGVEVQTFIGETFCGKGKTELVGDGASRVAVYAADVVSREQTAGCGTVGAEIRVKIGDRFATQTAKWQQGPGQLNITFGSATPAPIPTFTPTPRRSQPTQTESTPGPGGPAATPTPGGPPTETPGADSTVRVGDGASVTPTLAGGVRSDGGTQDGEADDSAGGFPVWAGVLIGLGAVAIVGGAVGLGMARNRGDHDMGHDPRDDE